MKPKTFKPVRHRVYILLKLGEYENCPNSTALSHSRILKCCSNPGKGEYFLCNLSQDLFFFTAQLPAQRKSQPQVVEIMLD